MVYIFYLNLMHRCIKFENPSGVVECLILSVSKMLGLALKMVRIGNFYCSNIASFEHNHRSRVRSNQAFVSTTLYTIKTYAQYVIMFKWVYLLQVLGYVGLG
jgi:hypothetical protein